MVGISSEELGKMFYEKRKQIGINTVILGNSVDVAPNHYRMMEHGKNIIKNPYAVAKICRTLCDDGTLMACWAIAYLKLEFFDKKSLETAVAFYKMANTFGPLNMEESHD